MDDNELRGWMVAIGGGFLFLALVFLTITLKIENRNERKVHLVIVSMSAEGVIASSVEFPSIHQCNQYAEELDKIIDKATIRPTTYVMCVR